MLFGPNKGWTSNAGPILSAAIAAVLFLAQLLAVGHAAEFGADDHHHGTIHCEIGLHGDRLDDLDLPALTGPVFVVSDLAPLRPPLAAATAAALWRPVNARAPPYQPPHV